MTGHEGSIEAMIERQNEKPAEMSAAEALFAFTAWLQCDHKDMKMSSLSMMAASFCAANKLTMPEANEWTEKVVIPGTEETS